MGCRGRPGGGRRSPPQGEGGSDCCLWPPGPVALPYFSAGCRLFDAWGLRRSGHLVSLHLLMVSCPNRLTAYLWVSSCVVPFTCVLFATPAVLLPALAAFAICICSSWLPASACQVLGAWLRQVWGPCGNGHTDLVSAGVGTPCSSFSPLLSLLS